MQSIVNKSLNDTMFYRDIAVLKYNIEYPVFSSNCNQKAVKAINEFYAFLAKNKENYCKLVVYPQAVEAARYIQKNNPPFNYYEFDMSYTITWNTGCVTSLYVEEYTYMGGAHGSTVRTSDTWNFTTGRRIQLTDLYSHDIMIRKKILVWIENKISEMLKISPATFFDDYAKRLQDTLNLNSFYLVPNGIVIYFQQYDIAPYVARFPEFLLPHPNDVVE